MLEAAMTGEIHRQALRRKAVVIINSNLKHTRRSHCRGHCLGAPLHRCLIYWLPLDLSSTDGVSGSTPRPVRNAPYAFISRKVVTKPTINSAAPKIPNLADDGRVLEGVVTTINADGTPNIAPMGPVVGQSLDYLWLRPFSTSTTYQNLKRTGAGVFHVTDDVELLAQAAIGQPDPPPALSPAPNFPGVILTGACRWYAFAVASLDDSTERVSIVARVVDRGQLREFFGFNRAKHAVLEAAILATRLHILDAQCVRSEFERLAVMVQKTGAAAEHRALAFLRRYIEQTAAHPQV